MNCRTGDLAVIVRSVPANIGIFVKVLRLDPSDATWAFESASRPILMFHHAEPAGFFTETGDSNAWLQDSALRPIRDQPGADETLSWAGLPAELETA